MSDDYYSGDDDLDEDDDLPDYDFGDYVFGDYVNDEPVSCSNDDDDDDNEEEHCYIDMYDTDFLNYSNNVSDYDDEQGLGNAEKELEQKAQSTTKSGSRKRPKSTKKPKIKSDSVRRKLKKKNESSSIATKHYSNNKKRKNRVTVKLNPKVIRKFSATNVKISKSSTTWARKMADTYLDMIHKYCRRESEGIFSHFEYTGSFYEHLKTEDANELDIIVALDTKINAHLIVEKVVPGYARIKATRKSSKYWRRFVDNDGYVVPKKIINWFFGLVQKAVDKDSTSEVKGPILKLSENGPAATLIIDDKEAKRKLEVDLVPAFLFKPKKDSLSAVPGEEKHYVAKNLPEEMMTDELTKNICPIREMLWRQSFSLKEKRKMKNLDKDDSGCRREVVKVIKTIVKKDGPPLAILKSYHIKTAFLHYNFDKGQEKLDWSRKHLAERFLGLMEYLRKQINKKHLSHFFIKELNLLTELSDANLENIEGRLIKLISNENEVKKALKQRGAKSKGKSKTISKSNPKKRKLQ